MERLARLAERRARWVVTVAAVLFIVSAALGAGVASRLDPFGVDDPATESVIADERLEEAGFRETSVVVLVEEADPRSREGRERIAAITRTLGHDSEVAAVTSFLSTGARDFISRDGDSSPPTTGGARTRQSGSPSRWQRSRASWSAGPHSRSVR
jgi:RND superfamily putative drug exporter